MSIPIQIRDWPDWADDRPVRQAAGLNPAQRPTYFPTIAFNPRIAIS
jgi:hypothetical protein